MDIACVGCMGHRRAVRPTHSPHGRRSRACGPAPVPSPIPARRSHDNAHGTLGKRLRRLRGTSTNRDALRGMGTCGAARVPSVRSVVKGQHRRDSAAGPASAWRSRHCGGRVKIGVRGPSAKPSSDPRELQSGRGSGQCPLSPPTPRRRVENHPPQFAMQNRGVDSLWRRRGTTPRVAPHFRRRCRPARRRACRLPPPRRVSSARDSDRPASSVRRPPRPSGRTAAASARRCRRARAASSIPARVPGSPSGSGCRASRPPRA
jgi:hypothetical protein